MEHNQLTLSPILIKTSYRPILVTMLIRLHLEDGRESSSVAHRNDKTTGLHFQALQFIYRLASDSNPPPCARPASHVAFEGRAISLATNPFQIDSAIVGRCIRLSGTLP